MKKPWLVTPQLFLSHNGFYFFCKVAKWLWRQQKPKHCTMGPMHMQKIKPLHPMEEKLPKVGLDVLRSHSLCSITVNMSKLMVQCTTPQHTSQPWTCLSPWLPADQAGSSKTKNVSTIQKREGEEKKKKKKRESQHHCHIKRKQDQKDTATQRSERPPGQLKRPASIWET